MRRKIQLQLSAHSRYQLRELKTGIHARKAVRETAVHLGPVDFSRESTEPAAAQMQIFPLLGYAGGLADQCHVGFYAVLRCQVMCPIPTPSFFIGYESEE